MIEQSLDIILSALVWSIPVAFVLLATERLNRSANIWRTPQSIHAANRGFLGLTLVAILGLTAFFGFSVKSWQIAISIDAAPLDGSAVAFPPEATELSSLGYGLLAIWFLGAAAMFVRLALSAQRSGSLFDSVMKTGHTYSDYEDVFLSDEVREPVTVGVWRQAIVLPASKMNELRSSEVKAVIAHERAHIARFDPSKNLALQIMRCLFCFN
ncbi:MAG: M56 family metallopeptidase [Pseudomonadota bacterium]